MHKFFSTRSLHPLSRTLNQITQSVRSIAPLDGERHEERHIKSALNCHLLGTLHRLPPRSRASAKRIARCNVSHTSSRRLPAEHDRQRHNEPYLRVMLQVLSASCVFSLSSTSPEAMTKIINTGIIENRGNPPSFNRSILTDRQATS